MHLNKDLLDKARQSLHKLGENQAYVPFLQPLWELVASAELDLEDSDKKKELDQVVKDTWDREWTNKKEK
jgi:hypothetical protein